MIDALLQPLDSTDRSIEAKWRQLEERTHPSLFTSWDWVGTLLATLPPKCDLSLLCLSKQSETVGIALLGQKHARRHLLVSSEQLHFNSPGNAEYDCLTTEDNQLLAQPELESTCWDAVLTWFEHGQSLADELIIPGLRQQIPLSVQSQHSVVYDNTVVRSFHVDLNRLQAADGRFERLLSKNARYQLRRSVRDYGGPAAVSLAAAKSAEEALDWFESMKVLHIASWTRRGKPHSFLRPFFESFHRSLIKRTFYRGRIQMLRIDANGHPIGYLYNFRDGHRTYAYQSGFADQDRRLRPGAVSHALAIELNFRKGVAVYDFMAGENRLKSSFATDTRELYWTRIQLPRIKFRLENLARQAKRSLFGTDKVN